MARNSVEKNIDNRIMADKKTRNVFYFLIAISFATIFIFNYLTPFFNDDYCFMTKLKDADSFSDLFRQQYEEYMEMNGRAVLLFFVRLGLYLPNILFKIANSLIFVVITLLMYANISDKKKYDIRLLILVTLSVWFGSVAPEETIFWQTGACNYLWGAVIILGFITLYRTNIKKEKTTTLTAIGMFVFGIFAGWCNENTSGGGILATLALVVNYKYIEPKYADKLIGTDVVDYGINNKESNVDKNISLSDRKIKPWMIAGIVGQICGFLIMVFAPGYRNRIVFMEENHDGLLGIMARFQKITLVMKNEFFILIAIFVVLFIVCLFQGRKLFELRNAILFFGLFVLTSYALILIPEPQVRAYFGAGIFLLIAIAQLFVQVVDSEKYPWSEMVKTIVITLMSLYFVLMYFDAGANLDRIRRQANEQVDTINEAIESGNTDVIYVKEIDKSFDNPYTYAYTAELKEDPEYWVNKAYCEYFEVGKIVVLPRTVEQQDEK